MTRPFDFDRETGVTRLDDGRFQAQLDTSWWVHRGPNGGYLAALALRALAETVADPDRAPRSHTVHYTSPPGEGALEIETVVERSGRSLTTCSGRLTQGGKLVGLALGAFSRARPGTELNDLVMPAATPPDELEDDVVPEMAPQIASRWQHRWAIGPPPFSPSRARSEEARGGGWLRLPEGHVVDAVVAAAITDAAVPAIFTRLDEPILVPTVDLTIHFRTALPLENARDDDWVLAVFRTGAVADGFLEEDGELWSADGRLLAQSRQLAAVFPLPEPLTPS